MDLEEDRTFEDYVDLGFFPAFGSGAVGRVDLKVSVAKTALPGIFDKRGAVNSDCIVMRDRQFDIGELVFAGLRARLNPRTSYYEGVAQFVPFHAVKKAALTGGFFDPIEFSKLLRGE